MDKFLIMDKAPNTISQIGIIFCFGQSLICIEPIVIIAMGMAISINKIIVIDIEQQKNVPIFLISFKLSLVLSLAYLTLLKSVDDVGKVTENKIEINILFGHFKKG